MWTYRTFSGSVTAATICAGYQRCSTGAIGATARRVYDRATVGTVSTQSLLGAGDGVSRRSSYEPAVTQNERRRTGVRGKCGVDADTASR